MAKSEEKLKSLLMRVKEESERTSLKLNIKKTKIMASGPILHTGQPPCRGAGGTAAPGPGCLDRECGRGTLETDLGAFFRAGSGEKTCWWWCFSRSVMSDFCDPHGLQPTRLLCPWDAPGKNTGVVCHALLQEIFPTQGLNPCLLHLLHWQAGSLPAEPLGKPILHNES